MVHLEILRDTREQKGWGFDALNATISDETISTGDYTLPSFCNYDEENDTYNPNYAIERKGGEDFIDSIFQRRDRFQSEVQRADDWQFPLLVLVEEPRRTFRRNRKFMQYRDATWPKIRNTTDAWQQNMNVEFQFVGSREKAQQVAFEKLATTLRLNLLG